MDANYNDLESRLVLHCADAHRALNKNLSFSDFKAELEKSFNHLKEMFVKKYKLQDDVSTLKRVESVIQVYKMECLTKFMH